MNKTGRQGLAQIRARTTNQPRHWKRSKDIIFSMTNTTRKRGITKVTMNEPNQAKNWLLGSVHSFIAANESRSSLSMGRVSIGNVRRVWLNVPIRCWCLQVQSRAAFSAVPSADFASLIRRVAGSIADENGFHPPASTCSSAVRSVASASSKVDSSINTILPCNSNSVPSGG